MTSAPQIRLRTVFLLFFCAAVGLTVSSKDPLGAISPTIEIAIVIGLLQQAWQLFVWRTPEYNFIKELSFARRFAILWRFGVAAILGAYVIWQVLLAKQFVTPPNSDEVIYIDPLDDGLAQLCILIALYSSLIRWRSVRSHVSFRAIRTPLLWALGIAIALIMLIEGTTIEFLVHRAVHNIDKANKFPRVGLYVQLGDEGYNAIWFGAGAIACLFGAIALMIHLRDEQSWPRVQPYRWIVFLLLLSPSAAFYIWYEWYEFYRLSPDMAGAGHAFDSYYLFSGGLLAAVAVTAGSYRLAAKSAPVTTIRNDRSENLDRNAFHESFLVLILLVVDACVRLIYLAWEILTYGPMVGTVTVGRFISFFCYPTSLLLIATVATTIQFCWVRWKSRSRVVPWSLHALSPQLFRQSWIMLILLTLVGIPTIRAFAFLLWLGPYNLPSLYGF